jgi:hypothetical protein
MDAQRVIRGTRVMTDGLFVESPEERVEHLEEFAETFCTTVAGGCGQAEALSVFGQTLCTTVAGGCGQAEALLVFGQTLCTTVAGGCGQAETPEALAQMLCATVAGGRGQAETPEAFGQTLCATVAGGCGQAETPEVFGQMLCANVAGGRGQAREPDEHGEHLYPFAQTLCSNVARGCDHADEAPPDSDLRIGFRPRIFGVGHPPLKSEAVRLRGGERDGFRDRSSGHKKAASRTGVFHVSRRRQRSAAPIDQFDQFEVMRASSPVPPCSSSESVVKLT